MFTGFNFEANTVPNLKSWAEYGDSLFRSQKAQVEEALDKFILNDGVIDGTAMQENWFPRINSDVFISHSHDDKELALGLAAFLKYAFGLTPFIDSCVWGYANDLQKKLDEYCKNPDGHTYDYDQRNYSTSHVHMMLASALTMMIDETECVFFINTPSSITSKDVIANRTSSPWIYHELGMTNLIRKKSPESHRQTLLKSSATFTEDSMQKNLSISYVADLGSLYKISDSDFQAWLASHAQAQDIGHALDRLYKLKRITPKYLAELETIHE